MAAALRHLVEGAGNRDCPLTRKRAAMDTLGHNLDPIATRSEWTPERVASSTRNAVLITAGGVALGLLAAAVQLYWISAIIGASVLIVLLAWQFESALLIYTLVAFIPLGQTPDLATGGSGVGKGLYTAEIMLGFLLVVWFARYLLGTLPRNRISSGFYVPLALYMGYCVINVWHSFIFWDTHVSRRYQYHAVNCVEVGLHLLSGAALVMMATSIADRKWLKRITVALFVAGIYNCLNATLGSRIPMQSPFWPFLTLVPACYMWLIVMDSAQSPWKRILCGGGIALVGYQVFYQGITWVSGWFGLVVALGVVTFLRSTKAFSAMLIVLCVLAAIVWPFIHANVIAESEQTGDYERFSLLTGAVKYATNFPLGVGLGNYRTYNSFYYGEKWGTTSYTSAHGTYAQHLSEMGFPGLLLILAVLVSGFRWMLLNYREMRPGPSKLFLAVAMGQMAGISAAALIGDYIIPTYHNGGLVTFSTTVYSWLIWGLAVAHVRVGRNETGDPAVSIHSSEPGAETAGSVALQEDI